MCKQKLLLINAPIDVKYKDSTSLFCPPLGLLSIKTFVEKNNNDIDIILLDGMILTQQDILEQILYHKPDIVGVSIQLLSYKNAVEICSLSKTIGAVTFLGGHHASQCYERILQNKNKIIDYIIYGDGEIATLMLCNNDELSKIPNLVYYDDMNNKVIKNNHINYCLDTFYNPYEAKNIDFKPYLINLKKSKFNYSTGKYLRIYSHKGCGFRRDGKKCVFCGRADEGYRFISIERYFQLIQSLNLSCGDFVFDVGDDLLGNKLWLKEAVEYKEKNNIFISDLGVFGRADEITEETAKALKILGVVDVTIGVESGDKNVLDCIGKRIFSTDIFLNAAQILFFNGINMTPSYVLGLPNESKSSVYKTIQHAEKIKELSIKMTGHSPNEIVANLLEPIPGSDAFKVLENVFPEKYINKDELELEEMQRDYFSTIHNLNEKEYLNYRNFLCESGRIINTMVDFADPQGWLNYEMEG